MLANNWEFNKGLLPQERHRRMVMSKDKTEQSMWPFGRLKTKQIVLYISQQLVQLSTIHLLKVPPTPQPSMHLSSKNYKLKLLCDMIK